MMIDANERIEKIKELLNELETKKEDFKNSLEIWRTIMSLDISGDLSNLYSERFSEFLNEKDYEKKEITDIWKTLNIKTQKEHPEMFDTVLSFATWHPDECLEIWLNTNTDDLGMMSHYKSIITNVLEAALDMEDEKTKLYVLQSTFEYSVNMLHLVDKNLIEESLKILSLHDPYMALYTYENLSEKDKIELEKVMNIQSLQEGILEELKAPKNIADIGALFSVIVGSKLPGLDVENYKKMIEEYYLKNPDEVLKTLEDDAFMIPEELGYIVISILGNKEQSGEDISKYKKDFEISDKDLVWLTQRKGIETLPKDINLTLKLDKIIDCQPEFLEKIQDKIKHVELGDGVHNEYSVSEIVALKEVVEELLDGIDLEDKNSPRREEKIFEQITKRLAKHIKYDYNEIKKEKQGEKLEKKLSNPNMSEEKRAKMKYKLKRMNLDKTKITARNSSGGLLYGKSVCSGYADIAKNVFSCVGIECRKIGGSDKSGAGHAWNQIKIDGKWYNMDLTWDRDKVCRGYPARWILKSDEQFKDHSAYKIDSWSPVEKCDTNIKKRDVKNTIIRGYRMIQEISKPDKIKAWLKTATKRINLDDINRIMDKLENDLDKGRDNNEK